MAFSDIQARIASDLRRDDLAADIANAINEAIKFWEGDNFGFNEKRFQLVTFAGFEYYSLSGVALSNALFPGPSGNTVVLTNMDGSALGLGELVLEIETMTCKPLLTGLPYPVTSRTMAWFDKNQANPLVAQGLPEFYAEFGGGMRIYPVPNAGHTLTLSGMARLLPNPLGAGTDTNAWLTEGEQLIREQAKAFLYRDVVRDMDGYANAMLALHGDDGGDAHIPGHVARLKRKGSASMPGRVEAWSL